MFKKLRARQYQIEMLHHAEAILRHDMGSAAKEIESVLEGLIIPIEELVRGGGGEGQATQRMRKALANLGWAGHSFEVKKIIDGEERESITHAVDHVKQFDGGTFALEIEWNNKDPFFDRDLENFKRLHADGAISVGCIITRGETLHEAMEGLFENFAAHRKMTSIDQLPDYCRPTERQQKM